MKMNFWSTDNPRIPTGFKIWFGFCLVLSLTLLAFLVWVVVKVMMYFGIV
jgi:hypothetical protein